jgi:hypothetical protein
MTCWTQRQLNTSKLVRRTVVINCMQLSCCTFCQQTRRHITYCTFCHWTGSHTTHILYVLLSLDRKAKYTHPLRSVTVPEGTIHTSSTFCHWTGRHNTHCTFCHWTGRHITQYCTFCHWTGRHITSLSSAPTSVSSVRL